MGETTPQKVIKSSGTTSRMHGNVLLPSSSEVHSDSEYSESLEVEQLLVSGSRGLRGSSKQQDTHSECETVNRTSVSPLPTATRSSLLSRTALRHGEKKKEPRDACMWKSKL